MLLSVSIDTEPSKFRCTRSALNSYPSLNCEDNHWVVARSRMSVSCSTGSLSVKPEGKHCGNDCFKKKNNGANVE